MIYDGSPGAASTLLIAKYCVGVVYERHTLPGLWDVNMMSWICEPGYVSDLLTRCLATQNDAFSYTATKRISNFIDVNCKRSFLATLPGHAWHSFGGAVGRQEAFVLHGASYRQCFTNDVLNYGARKQNSKPVREGKPYYICLVLLTSRLESGCDLQLAWSSSSWFLPTASWKMTMLFVQQVQSYEAEFRHVPLNTLIRSRCDHLRTLATVQLDRLVFTEPRSRKPLF
eukprot:4276872-Amphidinium_carterae.1